METTGTDWRRLRSDEIEPSSTLADYYVDGSVSVHSRRSSRAGRCSRRLLMDCLGKMGQNPCLNTVSLGEYQPICEPAGRRTTEEQLQSRTW